MNNTSNLEDIHNDDSDDSEFPKWAMHLETSYLLLIGIIGVPGNSLILIVQKKTQQKSSTDYLVGAMAFYELICSSVNVAVKIIMNTHAWKYIANNTVCRIHTFLIYSITFSSTYLLAAIAVDRYVKTCKPLSKICCTRVSKGMCVLLSVFGFSTGASTFVTYELDEKNECSIAPAQKAFQYNVDICVTTSIAVVVAIFTICYLNIAVTLRSRLKVRQSKIKASMRQQSGKWRVCFQVYKLKTKSVYPANQISRTTNVSTVTQNDHAADANIIETSLSLGESRTSRINSSQQNLSKSSSNRSSSRQTMAEQNLNRTTKIMFLLTIMYVVVWSVVCVCVMTDDPVLGEEMEKMARTIFMINCITNPVVFFCMSSKYRKKALSFVCRV